MLNVDLREKAVSVLHTVYMKYHWLHERAVVTDFVCPVLERCVRENNAKIQVCLITTKSINNIDLMQAFVGLYFDIYNLFKF